MMKTDNSNKIILDLCGGTGSWSRPYKEAGYDVRLITLPEYDVLTYEPPESVYGILAAPPCTEFSVLNCIAAPRERNEYSIQNSHSPKRSYASCSILCFAFTALASASQYVRRLLIGVPQILQK